MFPNDTLPRNIVVVGASAGGIEALSTLLALLPADFPAAIFAEQVIGIVLSGSLDDGTAGLWAIKDRCGLAVVQEPTEAAYPSMPLSAMQYVAVDHRATIAEMARLLPQLVSAVVAEKEAVAVSDKMEIETRIAREDNPLQSGVMTLGPLSQYTCPECSGVLLQIQEGNLVRFRCHTGHAYSLESLLAGIHESIDKTLWSTVRALEEHLLLLRHLREHARAQQDAALAHRLDLKAQNVEDQVQIVRQGLQHARRVLQQGRVAQPVRDMRQRTAAVAGEHVEDVTDAGRKASGATHCRSAPRVAAADSGLHHQKSREHCSRR